MVVTTSTHSNVVVTQTPSSTAISAQVVQSPRWEPEAIYQLVFGIVMLFLATPAALAGFYVLRRRTRSRTPSGDGDDGNPIEMEDEGDRTPTVQAVGTSSEVGSDIEMRGQSEHVHGVEAGGTSSVDIVNANAVETKDQQE